MLDAQRAGFLSTGSRMGVSLASIVVVIVIVHWIVGTTCCCNLLFLSTRLCAGMATASR